MDIKKQGQQKKSLEILLHFLFLKRVVSLRYLQQNAKMRCFACIGRIEKYTALFPPRLKSYSSALFNGLLHALLFVQTAFWVQNEHIKAWSSCMYAKLRKRHNDWKIFLIYGETEI